jgi:hypothetical protein
MIGGLSIEYAQARLQARYGQRGHESLWTRLRGARTFGAALETLRGSPLREWVAAIVADADADEVELRLRAGLRARVGEVAGWMPEAWQPAVRWVATLVDLPAVTQLAAGEAPPPWMKRDPVLRSYAEADAHARRAALRNGALGAVVRAIETRWSEGRSKHAVTEVAARTAWFDEWRRRWPVQAGEDAAPLDALGRLFAQHVARFAVLPVDEAWAVRRDFERQLVLRFRRHALTPAAVFAYLALVALDLERLRGQLVVRAAFGIVP